MGSIINTAMMNDRIGLSTICREAYSTYYSPALSLCPEPRVFVYAVAGQKPLTTGANVNPFKCAVVCVAIAVICGCDQGQPTSPAPTSPAPTPQAFATSAVTSVEFVATKKAAESGDATAQYNLGVMYATGEGVPQDDAEAVKWIRLSAQQGFAKAENEIGVWHEYGIMGIPSNLVEASKYYRKAADQGDADAQFNLGLMLDMGQGVPQDDAQAFKWYRLAAEQGNADAQCNLGLMHYNGQGVPQDYDEAWMWFRKAAEQGNAGAQYTLGVMHDNGERLLENDAEVVTWYRKAAEQGHVDSQGNLGVMYEDGTGVPQDEVEAYAWYSVAAALGDTRCAQGRNYTATQLTPKELAEGMKRAAEYIKKYGGER